MPKELENIDKFIKKFHDLEEKIIIGLSNKDYLDKEFKLIQQKYDKELEQLKLSKTSYENDLEYLNIEKKNVNLDIKNYKIHEDENLYKYLKYIIELGKEIGATIEIPKNIDKSYLNDFVFYSGKTIEKLGSTESIINKNILEIENVLEYGNKEDKELMEKLILNQKNINKKENKLKIKLLQEEMKRLEIERIFERGKKLIIKGRKVILNYPNNKDKFKINIKKIIRNDDNIDLKYSDTSSEINY